jgi:hypothetical protein
VEDVETIVGAAHPIIADLWSASSKRTYASAARALKRIIDRKKAA